MPEKIHTVSEISRDIRFALESQFRGGVWIEGEVSNLRVPGSGHRYFTLKDAGAQISCVMFRNEVQVNRIDLSDGQKIQIFGSISVYEARGQYQIVVQIAQPAGLGELQAQFEALKKKLHAEGLFDQEKKKPIPSFPRTIGVVTSPTGAALQDILKVLSRRAPWIRLIVIPVKVQGDGSAGEIARAIDYVSSKPEHLPEIDTLIVARGGGSIEDLWAFNEEPVARAIFACPLPIISGIGHEIDFTISDFVADRREPTPSAAVEAAVPDGVALKHRLRVMQDRLSSSTESVLRHHRQRIDAYRRELEAREPARKIQSWAQSLDYLDDRLDQAVDRRLEQALHQLERMETKLAGWTPEKDVERAGEHVNSLFEKLNERLERCMEAKTEDAQQFRQLLGALGPDKTLKRGFSMTLDENGRPILSAKGIQPGEKITTRFSDSEIVSVVEKS